jgi:hypothetical protein
VLRVLHAWGRRQETGDGRQETEDGRRKPGVAASCGRCESRRKRNYFEPEFNDLRLGKERAGERRRETGDGRQETEEGRRKTEDGRQETGEERRYVIWSSRAVRAG